MTSGLMSSDVVAFASEPPLVGKEALERLDQAAPVDGFHQCVHQLEPVEAVFAERQQVGQLTDLGERDPADHLDRRLAWKSAEVELDGLRKAAEVVHAQDDVVLRFPDVGQD